MCAGNERLYIIIVMLTIALAFMVIHYLTYRTDKHLVMPTAWARRVVSHLGPSGPDEVDYEMSYGDDPPAGPNWFPLYRNPPAMMR